MFSEAGSAIAIWATGHKYQTNSKARVVQENRQSGLRIRHDAAQWGSDPDSAPGSQFRHSTSPESGSDPHCADRQGRCANKTRRNGVRARFGQKPATNLRTLCRIGIRPHFSYTAAHLTNSSRIQSVVPHGVSYSSRPHRAVKLPRARRGEGAGGSGGENKSNYISSCAPK